MLGRTGGNPEELGEKNRSAATYIPRFLLILSLIHSSFITFSRFSVGVKWKKQTDLIFYLFE